MHYSYHIKVTKWYGSLVAIKIKTCLSRDESCSQQMWNIMQHKTPSLNRCDYVASQGYETFTIEGNFRAHTRTARAFLFITVGKIMPLFLDRHGEPCDSGGLPGGVSQESLLLCCHPIHGPPVILSACHAAAEGALGRRAVNIEQPVGCTQLMNDAINHIAKHHPSALF